MGYVEDQIGSIVSIHSHLMAKQSALFLTLLNAFDCP